MRRSRCTKVVTIFDGRRRVGTHTDSTRSIVLDNNRKGAPRHYRRSAHLLRGTNDASGNTQSLWACLACSIVVPRNKLHLHYCNLETFVSLHSTHDTHTPSERFACSFVLRNSRNVIQQISDKMSVKVKKSSLPTVQIDTRCPQSFQI